MSSPQPNMNAGVQPTPQSPAGPGPQVVVPPELPKKSSKAWIWGIVLVAAGAAGYWTWTQRQQKLTQASVVAVRTAPAESGPIARTLRLTGVTAAEKYISLIAPSLRGGRGGSSSGTSVQMSSRGGMATVTVSSGGSDRSGGNRSGSSTGSGSSVASAGTSLASTSGAASGGGGSSSGFSGGGDSVASSAGGSGGGGLRSARSASGGASRVAAPARSSRSSGASGSATLGSDGLGSTSGQIPGGGGSGGARGPSGSGGGGDFMMQLQTLAPNGSRIGKGEPVAEFDRQYMLLRLDDQKANVDQSEMSMKASMANLEVTRKSYDQQINSAQNLVEKSELDMKTIPVRSAIDAERLRLALEEAKANLKQLRAAAKFVDVGEQATLKVADLELAASKLELRRAQANADRMVLKAPIDGLVVVQNAYSGGEMKPIQQGDQVFPGMMFMQVVDPTSMVINASVNQVDIQHLRLGQRAKVSFDAFPGLVLPAHVVTIGAITKTAGMRGSFKKEVSVRLRLDRIDPRIIPDLSVSADVVLEEADSATVVPAEALMSDNSISGAEPKSFVMVRNSAGGWERRDVQLGLLSNTHAAIRGGVKPGEVVALEPPVSSRKPDDEKS